MSVQFQKLLFVMPEQEETFIAAMAAVSAYVVKLAAANIRLDINIVARQTWLSDLLVPPAYKMHASVAEAGTGYDLAVELTQERAEQLANATSRSCASGFGTLLGFESVGELVRLQGVGEPRYDIGIIWWGEGSTKFCEALQRMCEDATAKLIMPVVLKPRNAGFATDICNWDQTVLQRTQWEYSVEDALSCDLLVGMRSTLTYLAACAGRALIELYPVDEFEKSFYAKWSSHQYWMMLLERREAIETDRNYATLWKNFQTIWRQRSASKRRARQPDAVQPTA